MLESMERAGQVVSCSVLMQDRGLLSGRQCGLLTIVYCIP